MDETPRPFDRALADRYVVERTLGQGGMGSVYLAEDLKHHRKVAVKVLRPEVAAALGAERFLREIDIAAKLNHPHILALYDSGTADGFLFFVMPYIPGESLRQKLEREGQLSVDEALRITTHVASALDYAHAQGLLHRDIKPENILLHEREALVADFGIALAMSPAATERLTATGVWLGTPAYMSPEQATGERTLDARSDVYSLACICYEMLAGEPPYAGKGQALIVKHVVDPVPAVRRLRDAVPAGVEQALMRALAKAPADRFTSAGESPDGKTLAVARGANTEFTNIWIKRMDSGPGLKVTLHGENHVSPAWTPDGRSLTFSSEAAGGGVDLWTQPADGSGQAVLQVHEKRHLYAASWSPNGKWLIFHTGPGQPGAGDILAIRPGIDSVPVSVVATKFTEISPALSPDGRWLAYASSETGEDEIYVVPFPNTGSARWPISTSGGTEPLWSHSGNELFYRDASGNLVAVEVRTNPTFSVGHSTVLFPAAGFFSFRYDPQYAVGLDDQRFLMIRPLGAGTPDQIVVVENWFEELRSRTRN